MNKIYKVIWSKVKSCYVVVSEIAGSNGKSRRGRATKSALAGVLAVMLGFGGIVGGEAATVNDGDTLNGSTHITVTKDEGTNTITISATGLATTDEVTDLNTKVDANTGKINANTAKIGENKTKIDANTGKIDTNTAKIGENKTKIDANTGKINTNITNINANTAQINALKTLTTKVGLDANRPGVKYFRANSTGEDASATGTDAVAVGVKATANAHDSVSIGNNARNAGSAGNGVAIGTNAVSGSFSDMTADGDGGTVVVGGGKNSVSVGNKANARGNSSIALGDGAVVQNDGGNRIINNNSMAIGTAAKTVSSNNATAIGHGAFVAKNSHSAIAVGESAQAGKEAATAIGKEAAAKGKNSLAAGTSAVAEGENAVSVGQGTEAKGKNAVAIGNASQTAGSSSVAVGDEAGAAAGRSVSVGIGAGKGMIGDILGTKGSHVSIGDEAGQNVDGQHDIAIGTKAGGNVASNYNIAIGVEAGTNIGTAGNPSIGKNVSIGYNANKNTTLVSRLQATAVGSDTKAADDALALGFHAQAAGNGSIAAGFNALAEDAASMALGQGAKASGGNIAIGNGSEASAAMISGTGYLTGTAAPSTGVSVGTAAALRRITNVADGAQDQDAVTVAQLKKSIDETVRQVNASITSTTTTGVYYDTVTTGQGESITLKNTNNKGTVIHNVAKGTSGTDAVNVNQLNETVDQAKTHYYSVKSTSANNYNNDGAAGEDSMAAGVGAKALEKRSAAIGNNVEAQGEGSIALGTGYEEINGGTPTITQTVAASGYKYNMAIGAGAQSEGNHSIAMGTRAVTTIKNGGTSVDKAVAIGYAAGASDDKAVAIGSEAKSNSRSAVALGDRAHALANDALAIGTTASATGESSGAIGTANTVNGAGTYVIGARNSAPTTPVASNGSNITAVNSGVFGNENTLDGENNRVTGNSNIVKKETATGLTDIMLTGNNNTVSGDTDTTTQDDAGKVSGITITGSKNTVKAKNNTKNLTDVQIVGNNNTIDTSNKALDLSNTQILGSNVNATMGNSVYLGSGSAYVADSASTKGMAVYNSDGTYAYAGGTPAGVVTVGAEGKERRIQNVAAGLVGSQSTDAVNGSQLYTMTRPLRFGGDNSTIGATSAADVNVVKRGSDQAMSILGGADGSKLSDNNIGVVADAANNKFNVKLAKELKGLTSVTTGDTVMNNNGVTINNGAAGNTVSLTKDGLDNGGNKITNVASGGTTDSNAANIGDVKAAVTNVTNVLTAKGLDFEGNDGAANKVHRNLGTKLTIKGGLTDVTTGVSGKNLGVKKNAAGDGLDLVMSEKPEFTEVTAGTGTNKVVINDNGVHVGGKTYINNTGLNANNQKITNVAAGTDNSDAVNFGQLKDVVAAGKTILKDGKNTTVEGDGTANNPYKVNVKDNINLGEKGANGKDGSIGVNGKDGSAVVINGKDGSIGLNGTNGANGLTIKGANGANGVDGTDGNNGTNGMTRIVYEDKNGVTHEVATMGDGMKYGGDTGAVIKKKLNEQVNVVGGITDESKLTTEDNLGVVSDGSNNLKVKMAKELKGLTSVTTKDAAGNTTVTNGAGTTMTDSAGNKTEVTAGGIAINKHDNLNPDGTVKDPQKTVSLTADGLNNGGNQIHNVAKGTAGTDAVNVDQLKDEIAANATKLVDGKNTTVEGDGTAANPYKVNVKDNINLGEKGANGKDGSIGVNGKDGSAVVINGKDGSIGLNGKDGKDGLTMKSAAGANGVDGTDGNNGTNGMTRIVYEDKNHVTHEVATMDDGLKFAGNTGTVAKKLNETMTIKGTGRKLDTEYDSSNIKTMVNGNGEMIVGLDKNLKADSLAINGKDGKDGATIKGGDGKPGVDGTNITRLVIEEKDGTQHDIATLDDGMKYGGDTGAVIKKKLNEQVNVVGGITDTNKLTTEDNLGVVSDGNNNLKVRMAKDLKGLETVTTKTVTADTGNITTVNSDTVNAKTVKTGDTTINDNGLTINNGPSITKNGVDAGDKKITNVAPGDISPTSKDAVNGSQLFQTNQSISRLGDRVNKVGAGAAALAALHPLDFDPDDKWDVAAGYGNYKDAHAVAVGAFYRPNEDTMFSVGGSFGGGENMVNAGVSLKLGQGNHVSTSKVAMAKEIKDLRNEVEQLRSALGQVVQGQALDPMKIKLFPDIPENHWAYEYIATLAGNDIIEGYPDGNFGGDRMMTRYEFGAIVYRAMQRGFEVPARMLKEFEPELERFRVDTIAQNKAGQPTIERVRVIHNR